jgi:hypothetical protein
MTIWIAAAAPALQAAAQGQPNLDWMANYLACLRGSLEAAALTGG